MHTHNTHTHTCIIIHYSLEYQLPGITYYIKQPTKQSYMLHFQLSTLGTTDVLQTAGCPPISCPTAGFIHRPCSTSCYKVIKYSSQKTRNDLRDKCFALGAGIHLVAIETKEEFLFLKTLTTEAGILKLLRLSSLEEMKKCTILSVAVVLRHDLILPIFLS